MTVVLAGSRLITQVVHLRQPPSSLLVGVALKQRTVRGVYNCIVAYMAS